MKIINMVNAFKKLKNTGFSFLSCSCHLFRNIIVLKHQHHICCSAWGWNILMRFNVRGASLLFWVAHLLSWQSDTWGKVCPSQIPLAPLQPWLIPGVHVFVRARGRHRERERGQRECVCACRCRSGRVFVSAFVRGSLRGCLRVSRQTPSGQSQIKSPHLFVAFEEDCVCHLPGANAMLT